MKYMVSRLRSLSKTVAGPVQVSPYSLPEWELAEASRAMPNGAVTVGPLAFDVDARDDANRHCVVWTKARARERR